MNQKKAPERSGALNKSCFNQTRSAYEAPSIRRSDLLSLGTWVANCGDARLTHNQITKHRLQRGVGDMEPHGPLCDLRRIRFSNRRMLPSKRCVEMELGRDKTQQFHVQIQRCIQRGEILPLDRPSYEGGAAVK